MSLDVQGSSRNKIHVLITAWEWKSYFTEPHEGLRVKLGTWKRTFPCVALNRTKAIGFYLDSFLAHREAKRDGYDEALLLDEHGYVAEATASNVFLVNGDTLITPIVDAALPGITRHSVMAIAGELGLHVEERRIKPLELVDSAEVFLTGTACEVVAVTHVNGAPVGDGIFDALHLPGITYLLELPTQHDDY